MMSEGILVLHVFAVVIEPNDAEAPGQAAEMAVEFAQENTQVQELTTPPAEAHSGQTASGWEMPSIRPMQWALTTSLYPSALQALSVVVFTLIFYFAFFTIRGGQNYATVVTWTL
jgi:hypothetical protein